MQTIRIAVTGTDTDAGKTVLSLLMMQYLIQRGKRPFYLKPFQTGCKHGDEPSSDAGFVFRNIEALKGINGAGAVINCLETPKAPFFAARDMGMRIDVEYTLRKVKEKGAPYTHVIMEGAGGLYVPLTEEVTMLDFIEMSGFKTVIAARAGLGTINHTLMTIESLRSRGIEPGGIVFMDGGSTPVPDEMVEENMEAVALFSGIPVTGVIGRIENFKKPGQSCYPVIASLFRQIKGLG